ncbi:MAG: EAL domain-containing protein [Desulfohalobiaceae bacterium]|nr:EAL domain-containing protein [Desulfohalobiaceae bacterium]
MNGETKTGRFARQALEQTRIPFFLGEENGRIAYANQAWKSLLGQKKDLFEAKPWFDYFKAGKNLILEQKEATLETELVLPSEEERWVALLLNTIRTASGQSLFACFVIDYTEYKKKIQEIQISCLHDPLTGLANRILLLDRLNVSLKLHQRDAGHGFSLLYIDLDDFKGVNDELGHTVGDKLLMQTAKRLLPLFRAQDTVCRWGGDEFIVLLDDLVNEKSVKKKAQLIHETLSQPFVIDEHELNVSASIGIATSSAPFDRAEDLLILADQAMYKSKAAGKSRTTLQAPVIRTHSEFKQLEQDMRSGYKRDEFHLVYQPIMDLKSMRISGLEALVRWEHPRRGILYPKDFFPIADRSHFSERLGAWILWQACRQMSKWQAAFRFNGKLKIHVNISSCQFKSPAFQPLLDEVLAFCKLEPETINLECRKESFLNGDRSAGMSIEPLKRISKSNLIVDNLKISLENLNFLFNYRFIPFSMVKIDQSQINYLNTNQTIYNSLKTFIRIFSQIGIELAVKGIESKKQLNTLKMANCHYGQGYYFSKPLNLHETESYLRKYFESSSASESKA